MSEIISAIFTYLVIPLVLLWLYVLSFLNESTEKMFERQCGIRCYLLCDDIVDALIEKKARLSGLPPNGNFFIIRKGEACAEPAEYGRILSIFGRSVSIVDEKSSAFDFAKRKSLILLTGDRATADIAKAKNCNVHFIDA